ncbi:PTS sugar transporter subunit IIA [Aeromicrobium sp.]|uniref:PTS sugar transporter subunit IIA n=1 Tax=Aeromicrobium sp. TaxID=1871063 RepID=UPI003D6B3E1F
MPDVVAPVPGRVVGLADVPDPVFAQQVVGSGVAIDPDRAPGTAVAPVAGRLLKLHPHAFIVLTASGKGVLVHLGIDTVQLDGKGFDLLASEGDEVAAGDPVVRWDPAAVETSGRSPIVPVVVMDTAADTVSTSVVGSSVDVGDRLF